MDQWHFRSLGEQFVVSRAQRPSTSGSPVDVAHAAFLVESIADAPHAHRQRPALVELLSNVSGLSRFTLERATVEQLTAHAGRAIRRGELVARRTSGPTAVEQHRSVAPLGPAEALPVWYEVKVVDPAGRPIAGIELAMTIDGAVMKQSTDGGGKVRLDDIAESASVSIALADPKKARETAQPMWDEGLERTVKEGRDVSLVCPQGPKVTVHLPSKTPQRLVLLPRLVRLRLKGMHFDTAKCFLLPQAMKGIRKLRSVYDETPDPRVLITGHTDTAGTEADNTSLSLERADSISAFLSNQVPPWLAYYDAAKSNEKRWGTREDQYMLSALPESSAPYLDGAITGVRDARTLAAIKQFQAAEGLEVDGITGPKTRGKLIEKYMGLEMTTLPEGAEVVTHGCGEFFREVDTGDGVAEQANRRVEIFMFSGSITPPPPGKTSAKGSTEYPQWRKKVSENVDLDNAGDDGFPLHVQLHDDTYAPCANVAFRVIPSSGDEIGGVTDGDGWAFVVVPGDGSQPVRIEYPSTSEPDASINVATVALVDRKEETEEALLAHLSNLGFLAGDGPQSAAILRFQAAKNLPRTASFDGDTRAAILRAAGGGNDSVTQELRT